MVEPRQHTEHRGFLESILRIIPGFHGYLEKEYRRDSDALQRTWLTEHLQQSKRAMDAYALQLVDAGRLDQIVELDRLRARLDKIITRIKGAWQGYSGMFDLVRVKTDLLDRVYEHDVSLMGQVEAFTASVERLAKPSTAAAGSPAPATPAVAAPPLATATAAVAVSPPTVAALNEQLDAVEQGCDHRVDLLKGLE